jgi:hypothetical protein
MSDATDTITSLISLAEHCWDAQHCPEADLVGGSNDVRPARSYVIIDKACRRLGVLVCNTQIATVANVGLRRA